MAKTKPLTVRKGHVEFQYRQNKKGQWETRGPLSATWSRIRSVNDEVYVAEAIGRLIAQGYEVVS